jgi:hypothetical protein
LRNGQNIQNLDAVASDERPMSSVAWADRRS